MVCNPDSIIGCGSVLLLAIIFIIGLFAWIATQLSEYHETPPEEKPDRGAQDAEEQRRKARQALLDFAKGGLVAAIVPDETIDASEWRWVGTDEKVE